MVALVHGDEPWQVAQSCTLYRQAATAAGFDVREHFVMDADFDWSQLQQAGQSLSLFAEKRLIALHWQLNSVRKAAADIMQTLLEQAGDDYCVLIYGARLDRKVAKLAWATWAAQQGVEVAVWPLAPRALGRWLGQRLQEVNLYADSEALHWLVERSEGNMLAAAQEVEKLALLLPPGPVKVEDLLGVADNARYSVYDLTSALLEGRGDRFVRIAWALRAEGEEAVVALWALSRELRTMVQIGEAGVSVEQAMRQLRVIKPRQASLQRGLARMRPAAWRRLLSRLGYLDAVAKGRADAGADAWAALVDTALPYART